jgi:hypothetical protein
VTLQQIGRRRLGIADRRPTNAAVRTAAQAIKPHQPHDAIPPDGMTVSPQGVVQARLPYVPRLRACAARRCTRSSSSRFARVDTGRARQAATGRDLEHSTERPHRVIRLLRQDPLEDQSL